MKSGQTEVKEYGFFAHNVWREAANNRFFEVYEPFSGDVFARVAGSRADARVAVDAAANAVAEWAATTPAEKARLFPKAGEIVKRRRSKLRKRLHVKPIDDSS